MNYSNISEPPAAITAAPLTTTVYAISILSHTVCRLELNVTALPGTRELGE